MAAAPLASSLRAPGSDCWGQSRLHCRAQHLRVLRGGLGYPRPRSAPLVTACARARQAGSFHPGRHARRQQALLQKALRSSSKPPQGQGQVTRRHLRARACARRQFHRLRAASQLALARVQSPCHPCRGLARTQWELQLAHFPAVCQSVGRVRAHSWAQGSRGQACWSQRPAARPLLQPFSPQRPPDLVSDFRRPHLGGGRIRSLRGAPSRPSRPSRVVRRPASPRAAGAARPDGPHKHGSLRI